MRPSRFVRTEGNVFYLAALPVPRATVAPEVGHHIFVIDRSGSMYGDIDALKQAVEQAIAVDSYTTDTLTTLISFSSHGDVTLHWSKVPSSQVMELKNPYIKILRAIRATYLTGISQALELALQQATPGQTTGITLFTDGYANDPSAYQEIKSLDAFTVKAAKVPGVFLNCIGYRDWCDWPRMNAMSNALSGKTVKAASFKDVLQAMNDTQVLLTKGVTPAIQIPNPDPGAVLMLAINHTSGQVNGTIGDLDLRGVGASDEVSVYAVRKADATYNIPPGIHVVPSDEAYLFAATALAYTANSDLRTAKELLFSSGNKTLWEDHQGAMTPSTLAAMVTDLQAWVTSGKNDGYDMGRNTRPKYDLFALAEAFARLPNRSVGLDTASFYKDYRRRSIKKLAGARNEDGTITPNRADLVARGPDRTYVYGLKFNTTDASVQLKTMRDVSVRRISDGKVLDEVEYVSLRDITDYKTPTLISCGERNVDDIPLEVYNKDAWNILREFLIPSKAAEEFFPGKKIRIQMKRFRMDGAEERNVDNLLAAVGLRNEATAHVKFLSAALSKAEASPYTAEQVAALSALHLTPALYFSSPSHVHYADKEEAARKGEIDSFTRYRILFGTLGIFSAGEFSSGNAFLKARYDVTENGAKQDKPTLASYRNGGTYVEKPPKKPLSEADTLMKKVFDGYFALPTRLSNDQISAALKAQSDLVDKANDLVQGLVMEIGCTGLLPRNLEDCTTRYEPDAFEQKFGIKLGKDEKEGIFFVATNGLVISVIPETNWYTVKVASAEPEGEEVA